MEFGKKLQLLRKENKMSQEKLAEKINISRQAISKWEQGIARPDTDNIVQLSKFFQVPIEYLLFDEYENVKEIKSEEKNIAELKKPQNYKNAVIYMGIGIALEILACFLCYVAQYFDMKQNGSCYTNALNYMKEFPVVIFTIIGIIFILLSIGKVWKTFQEKSN